MLTLLALALAAQSSSDKLPPANPLPYTDADTANVLVPVNALFAAIEHGDAAALLAVTRADGGATAAIELPDGRRRVDRLSWAEFARYVKPGPDRYQERISDPAVEVDGDVAMVWAPYVLRKNGAVDHCGFDHFDLVREAGRWRILNVTWSQRTTGCAE